MSTISYGSGRGPPPRERAAERGRRCLVLVVTLGVTVAAASSPADGRAQVRPPSARTAPAAAHAAGRLRGVILAGPARFAVLERESGSRQQLLRVGEPVEHGVAVVSIAADRVVLSDEGHTVTLRLAHGGERGSALAPAPRAVPRASAIRRRR
jgi:type II secretory pathway component PulC